MEVECFRTVVRGTGEQLQHELYQGPQGSIQSQLLAFSHFLYSPTATCECWQAASCASYTTRSILSTISDT